MDGNTQRPPDVRVEKAYDYIHHCDGAVDYVHTRDNDPNHFSPLYYGSGKRENVPNVPKALDGWNRAAEGCRRFGLEVRNASPGTAITCFPIVGFNAGLEWLKEVK